MTIKKYSFPREKNFLARRSYIKVIEIDNIPSLLTKEVIKTRIRKDNNSIYSNTSSREIKKWFETRRIS